MASHSAEVAADFRDALQDLKINSRPEISNLTVIAKENTEHAQAISRELENHIRLTRPEWKLPALYVLDSIVKNVGTPYTVYLGRNLFRTFMEAYTLVDPGTRKAMEGLLKTWKLPVPESLDTRPVFSAEVTREIENALIKFRTVTIQHQQQQARNQRQPYGQLPARPPQQPQYRESPTPNPQGPYGYPIPPQKTTEPPRSPVPRYLSPAHQGIPSASRQPYLPPSTAPPPDIGRIKDTLKQIILSATMEVSQRPADERARSLLTTLLSLQKVLESGSLAPDQIRQVEGEIQRISGALLPRTSTPSVPTHFAPAPAPTQSAPPVALPFPFPPPAAASSQRATPQPSQPPTMDLSQLLRQFNPTPASAPSQARPPPQPANDLLASLRAAGLLGGGRATPEPSAQPQLQTAPLNDVKLDPVSLKISRPNLIRLLYSARPDQCRECARRFPATEEGKKRKTRHLDWHFKTNMRIADTSKSVISRSWYIDEREWIDYRESDDTSSDKGSGSSKAKKPDPKDQYVPVPTDASLANAHCPICQEKFDAQWHEETQQPVWFDAMHIGGRIYHASCYAELSKASGMGAGGAGGRAGGSNIAASNTARSTPDPILGKRKWHAGAE
ncbi:hypothetical protein P152DRAFT_107544 [Eremomyces bilateralis CBS 781.70]|uniref:CID domain-containing protein n=1 Tax=Eremomyces bilateralis CBS 781.70 TaxID=1392243 RepID=A0A6G1FWP2_9PEZI|nr:uncharacterized protein P152DRAFT_107544 [Eremomyces bilateralis CBS 781.70]KAF1810305.1 hypothetical protein P152DRAFT_107544 [Eremomyces bilateralis CBS 781.70]